MSDSPQFGRDDFGQGGLNDQLDADSLVDEIGLDGSEIRWRKDFIGFTDDDVRRLRTYRNDFADNADQVAEDFYDNLTDHEETVEVIGQSPKNVEQLKRTQSAYLTTLVEGEYGTDYFRDRARIGKLHDILDMPMKHYLGQYGVYYDLILPLVGDRLVASLTDRLTDTVADGGIEADSTEEEDALNPGSGLSHRAIETAVREEVDDALQDILALLRIINLDMQVVTDTYIHSYSQQLEEEIERNKQLMAEVEEDVKQPVSDLQTSADDVAESATAISDAATEQSDRVEEISSEVANLSATVEEVASTADQVENASERAETLAEDGKEAADTAAGVMDEIGESVNDVADDVSSLQERVGQIDAFVDAIDDIAEQTNMLALNASIEAARAGEAGEGFAVVADEIKSLAEESQTHASDIETMVDDIQTDTEETAANLHETTDQVDQGIEQVQDAMNSLTEIVEAITETANGISEVAAATDDQAAAAEEIASMVDEVVDRTDRVADEIESLAAANQEQAAMVSEVEGSVTRLSGERSTMDSGQDTVPRTDDEVAVSEADLPDNIPEFVVDMLSEEQLREVANGNLDPTDL
ncbi:globin-coupled sensor protein [Haloarcula halophila]|uniref:globin-coupled sensor protein n=1 Tax=Haloarcula TaxID=2237 RepID=UPI0023E3BAC3|nr:globin-coupled sensor protein [Halomicroarcula sp. DFY41]